MAEIVYIAAAMRAPIVMAVGNRALSGPINIHADHSDSMLLRDSGVVQLFVENAQEAYDFMVMAPRIAEHPDVLLPVFVGQDGFTITHSAEPVALLPDAEVKSFVGDYGVPFPLLDLTRVTSQGPFAMPDSYFELRVALAEAQAAAAPVLNEVLAEFAALSGRSYEAVESYRLEDAAHAIVVMGSSAGTVKDVVDELREEGKAVGVLQIRCFRPFPTERAAEALRCVADVAVLDRADSPGGRPPLYAEIAGLAPSVRSHVYGLGGRDLHPEHVRAVFAGEVSHYVGLRGGS
jgi:pyruvate ferredoxin oxidoreductase alpha subunit